MRGLSIMNARLLELARKGNAPEFKRILDERDAKDGKIDLNATDEKGNTALLIACQQISKLQSNPEECRKYYPIVENLIQQEEVDLNAKTNDNEMALSFLIYALKSF